jgi:hypothetical protein
VKIEPVLDDVCELLTGLTVKLGSARLTEMPSLVAEAKEEVQDNMSGCLRGERGGVILLVASARQSAFGSSPVRPARDGGAWSFWTRRTCGSEPRERCGIFCGTFGPATPPQTAFGHLAFGGRNVVGGRDHLRRAL